MIRWLAALLICSGTALSQSCPKTQVNLLTGGGQPERDTSDLAIAGNGRYVVWSTKSADVLPGMPEGDNRIFLSDLTAGTVEHVTVAFSGGDPNASSYYPTLSSSGRRVVFFTNANNLVATSQPPYGVYLRDLDAGTTERMDTTPSGGVPDDWPSQFAAISPCGRYVAFASSASNIVPGALVIAGWDQVYLRDLVTGDVELISTSSTGDPANLAAIRPAVQAGGRLVLFDSRATNLDPLDTGLSVDVFVKDRILGTLDRVSLDSAGLGGDEDAYDGQMSADGRFVAFESAAGLVAGTPPDIEQVYVRDRQLGTTVLVSAGSSGPGDDHSERAAISPCGRYVLFSSRSTNLWPGNTNGYDDVYLRDLETGLLQLLSLNADGSVPVARSYTSQIGPAFSDDGQSIAFLSRSKNMTAVPDPNGNADAFVDACPVIGPEAYCVAEVNSLGCTPSIGSSGVPSVAGGGFVVECTNALSQRAGLFYYSLSGPVQLPFQGGLRCVESPVRRTPLTQSGGSATLDCSGVFSIDFSAWVAGGNDPALVASQRVWGQWWSRDAGSSFSTNLSDAIVFDLVP